MNSYNNYKPFLKKVTLTLNCVNFLTNKLANKIIIQHLQNVNTTAASIQNGVHSKLMIH
jgi:hypothetical protein